MDLTLRRQPQTDGVTLGSLFVDGTFQCFTLEPADDEAHPDIPEGRYRVIVNMSTRFKRMLPLVIGVPGRLGIRIHPGSTSKDTSGCILLGQERSGSMLLNSRVACEDFQAKIAGPLASGETVWLDVTRSGQETKNA